MVARTMELAADCRIAHPLPIVFAAYRDRLLDLVPEMPNIRSIEVLSRTTDAGCVRMHNLWHGGGEIPAAARAFLSESMLSWDDHASWDEQARRCDWRIVTRAFRQAVHCQGSNHYTTVDDETVLQIRGVLEVDAGAVAGVPKLLAPRISKLVESMLADRIQPNLVAMAQGLDRLLTREAATRPA
jgi:hypothetical protein